MEATSGCLCLEAVEQCWDPHGGYVSCSLAHSRLHLGLSHARRPWKQPPLPADPSPRSTCTGRCPSCLSPAMTLSLSTAHVLRQVIIYSGSHPPTACRSEVSGLLVPGHPTSSPRPLQPGLRSSSWQPARARRPGAAWEPPLSWSPPGPWHRGPACPGPPQRSHSWGLSGKGNVRTGKAPLLTSKYRRRCF